MPRYAFAAVLMLLIGCQPRPHTATPSDSRTDFRARVGVLVMAHGAGPEWDEAVDRALAPIRRALPTVLALGMADAPAMRTGLDSLRALGVDRVAVVRLFLSGQSFLPQTRALLGLGPAVAGHDGGRLPVVGHDLRVATHSDGLLDAPLTTEVLVARVLAAAPRADGSLMLVAHGMGDPDENDAVLRAMQVTEAQLRQRGFSRVALVTLREDWPEERAESEARMRTFVAEESRTGRTVLVVPVRLFGFGPYAEILKGLDYTTTPALLPHPAISQWILDTANEIACREGWQAITGSCPIR